VVLSLLDWGGFLWRVMLNANCFFARDESRHVMPGVNDNVEGILGPFALVILTELLSKPMELHPHDGIPVLVEIRLPCEDFCGETVFLDLVRSSLEILIANVLEQPGLLGGFVKDS
jgi:hypothetical protein